MIEEEDYDMEEDEKILRTDPVKLSGGYVPALELKVAQQNARGALNGYIEAANEAAKLLELLQEFEKAGPHMPVRGPYDLCVVTLRFSLAFPAVPKRVPRPHFCPQNRQTWGPLFSGRSWGQLGPSWESVGLLGIHF